MEYARPNRSDNHLNAAEAAEVESAARHYFDDAAPKRHTKPQRSEYSSTYADAISSDNSVIPEFIQFQNLEKDTEKLVFNGGKVSEEFTGTEYYTDLNGVDKQHHTTGTGFISTDTSSTEYGFALAPDIDSEHHASCTSNPATNDWIPAPNDKVEVFTRKPSRSN